MKKVIMVKNRDSKKTWPIKKHQRTSTGSSERSVMMLKTDVCVRRRSSGSSPTSSMK